MKSNSRADLLYVDDSIDTYSDIFNYTQTEVTYKDKVELIKALKALKTKENIEEYWNIDSIINYFAVNTYFLNFDNYTGSMLHNYFLLQEKGKIKIIPWDYNLAFSEYVNAGIGQKILNTTRIINYGIDLPLSRTTKEERPLLILILSDEEYLQKYHESLNLLISNVKYYTEEIDRIYKMIEKYVENDPTAFYNKEEFDKAVQTLKKVFDLRAESIKKQLLGEIPTTMEEQEKYIENLVDASYINLRNMGRQTGKINKK